jgi:hypothetical protein
MAEVKQLRPPTTGVKGSVPRFKSAREERDYRANGGAARLGRADFPEAGQVTAWLSVDRIAATDNEPQLCAAAPLGGQERA